MKPPPLFFIATLLVAILGSISISHYLDQKRQAAENANKIVYKADIQITVVEGKRREEIANLLQEKGITSSKQFMIASEGKEGYLFPDTYRFFPDSSAQDVVKKMVDNFSKRTIDLNTNKDSIILASIIEREAKKDEERPIIAGVYTNRLNIGMKLDADPTVQYAKDTINYSKSSEKDTFEFWKPITQEDYKLVESNFNTYLSSGLPPTAICNPGLKSIKAALSPTDHDYLYFLHNSSGELIPSKTIQQHLQNIGR